MTVPANEDMDDTDTVRVEASMRMEFPEDLPIAYVSKVMIIRNEEDFIIDFFQEKGFSGTAEEQVELLQTKGYMPARCVARIGVSPGTMARIITSMTRSYQQYRSQSQEDEESVEDV